MIEVKDYVGISQCIMTGLARTLIFCLFVGILITGTSSDPCPFNPCSNGGVCVYHGNTFHCQCGQGYGGAVCQDNTTTFTTSGSSSVTPTSTTKLSFHLLTTTPTTPSTSTTTTTKTTPAGPGTCEFNPCSNGGVCFKVKDHFTCVCPAGFAGVVCQDIDTSPPSPAPTTTTSAVSASSPSTSSSTTPSTTSSKQLPTTGAPTHDSCSNQPCLNGGTCIPRPGFTFECKCPSGFGGPFCLPLHQAPTASNNLTCRPSSELTDGCGRMEVVYMVEYSQYESSDDVYHVGQFLTGIVDKYRMDSDHVRVGVVVFHDDVKDSIHITDFRDDKEGLKRRINDLTQPPCSNFLCWPRHQPELTPSGDPDLAKAFDFVREHSFIGARQGAHRVVAIILHSMATFGSRLPEIRQAAEKLKDECIVIYALVVSDSRSHLNKAAIQTLVTQPWGQHYLELVGFTCRFGVCLDTSFQYLNFNC